MNPIVATPGNGPSAPRDVAGKKPPSDSRPQWAKNVSAADVAADPNPAPNPAKNQPTAHGEAIIQTIPEPAAEAIDVEGLMSRFGGPRGPEFRVFRVTPEGPGPMLFRFEVDAYPDQISLAQKIARDHGEGEYDIRLFNNKGQPVAGGTRRIYVAGNPPAKTEAVQAPKPEPSHGQENALMQMLAMLQAQNIELIRGLSQRQATPAVADMNQTLLAAALQNRKEPPRDNMMEMMMPFFMAKLNEDPNERMLKQLELQEVISARTAPQDHTMEKALEGFNKFMDIQALEKEYELKKMEIAKRGGKTILPDQVKSVVPDPAATAKAPPPAAAEAPTGLMDQLMAGVPALLNMARREVQPDTAAVMLLSMLPAGAEEMVAKAAALPALVPMMLSKVPEALPFKEWLEQVRLGLLDVLEGKEPDNGDNGDAAPQPA